MRVVLLSTIFFSLAITNLKAQFFMIKVSAIDLSEDGTMLSSANDELILVGFRTRKEGGMLESPEIYDEYVLDTIETYSYMGYELSPGVSRLDFVLLERDDKMSKAIIIALLRVHWDAIRVAFNNKDYDAITNYLGDEDVLGYFSYDQAKTLTLKGMSRLDKYEYQITMED